MAVLQRILWIALGTLMTIHTIAAEPDRVGQEGQPVTRLGLRLAALAVPQAGIPDSPAYWKRVHATISASNAARDSRADASLGHIGFMTHANDTIAESPVAPGLKCLDRSETSRRAVFLFTYRDPVARETGRALLAFDTYARHYNAVVFRNGALEETSCILTGW